MEQQHFEALYPDTARFSEIQKLAGFVKEGTSAQLLSIPGVGRATILGLLANNKKIRLKHFGRENEQMHFVLVNFAEIRGRSLFDAMKFLFLSLADSLRERGRQIEYEKVNALFKDSLKFKDELVLFQALKEAVDYLVLSEKLNIILLFDRFEEYVPTVNSQFFANLRTLRQRAKYQFSVVFSLSRPIETILDPGLLSDYYEFVAGHYVYMGLFDSVTTSFRISYIEKITGKKLTQDILEQVIKETGGVGKLIKLSVELLLSEKTLPDKRKISDFLFSKKQIQEALSEICRSLTPAEQIALIKRNFDDNGIVDYLQCVGILDEDVIQIPLFDQHIRLHSEQLQTSPRTIIYDEKTNIIRSGDVVLSDQLTSSEFKLLKFLLQSREGIITRDGIIGVVWSEIKSTAGITDQAVDQLIFRLRRKIEEDPNHPSHLLTVKGRGFRFVP